MHPWFSSFSNSSYHQYYNFNLFISIESQIDVETAKVLEEMAIKILEFKGNNVSTIEEAREVVLKRYKITIQIRKEDTPFTFLAYNKKKETFVEKTAVALKNMIFHPKSYGADKHPYLFKFTDNMRESLFRGTQKRQGRQAYFRIDRLVRFPTVADFSNDYWIANKLDAQGNIIKTELI